MTVGIEVKMDINKILRDKFRKPAKKLFFDVAKTTYKFITVDSQTVGGVYGSPVVTGQFRASHTVALNAADISVKPEGNYPNRRLLGDVNALVGRFKLGDTLIIANSLPYAEEIEFQGKSRFKTPKGVYRVSAAAVKAKFSGISGGNL